MRNPLAGMMITWGGSPTVRRTRFHDGRASGIYVYENGGGTLEECDIYSNALSGVIISEEGNPVLHRCKLRDGLVGRCWSTKMAVER